MLIEHLIQRDGGTPVEFADKTYWFLPDDQGRHVAEVDDRQHQQVLLGNAAYRSVSPQTELPLMDAGADPRAGVAAVKPTRQARTRRFTPDMPNMPDEQAA